MLNLLGQAAGAIVGPAANYFSQQETNRANIDIANRQMAFQERMRATSHQTEVEDLKKAGLNPILSAGGSGSGTPTGGSTTLQAPQISMPDLLAYGVSLKQLEQKDAEIGISKAQSAADIAKNLSQADINKMETLLKKKSMNQKEAESSLFGTLKELMEKAKSIRNPKQPGSTDYNFYQRDIPRNPNKPHSYKLRDNQSWYNK